MTCAYGRSIEMERSIEMGRESERAGDNEKERDVAYSRRGNTVNIHFMGNSGVRVTSTKPLLAQVARTPRCRAHRTGRCPERCLGSILAG